MIKTVLIKNLETNVFRAKKEKGGISGEQYGKEQLNRGSSTQRSGGTVVGTHTYTSQGYIYGSEIEVHS